MYAIAVQNKSLSCLGAIDHYKIYLVIHGYTISRDKGKAKTALQGFNISDNKNFKPEIEKVINEIMDEEETHHDVKRKKRVQNKDKGK